MHAACNKGHLDVVKILQAHGASIDVITEVINDHGLKLSIIYSYYTYIQDGWSPLMCTCASDDGHVTVVAELLSHGANVELCTEKVLAIQFSAIVCKCVLLIVWIFCPHTCC